MKKVLITGGAGFIGSNYAHYHYDKYDDRVFVLDKLTYAGNLDNLARLMDQPRFTFIKGDIADRKFVLDLFDNEKFDTVINFAAETHVDRSIVDSQDFVDTNIKGTHNLLDAARKYDSRYHQISTDEVYGDLGDNSKEYFTEKTPIDPNCPYAATKASADLLVNSYFETYKMPVTISRCSNNYGPYQFPEKLIPYFFRLAAADKSLPMYGDGKNVRDWLYVIDHCRAIDLVVQSDRYGEVYNIGGHNEKQNLEIARLILKYLGKSEDLISFVPDRLAHDRRYAMDPSKITRDFDWKPSVTFEEGIARTFEWYEQNREWWLKLIAKHEVEKHEQEKRKGLHAKQKVECRE